MTLTRWDPFNDLLRLQQRMNRLFEESMGRSEQSSEQGQVAWSPAVDIYETPEDVVLLADLPGVRPEDVDVRVEANTLVIKGERHMEEGLREENFHRRERGAGRFSRTFTLAASINQDHIRAEHRNGMLRVTLPKAEGTRPRRIPVQTQGES